MLAAQILFQKNNDPHRGQQLVSGGIVGPSVRTQLRTEHAAGSEGLDKR